MAEKFEPTVGATNPDELWPALGAWATRPTASVVQADTRQRLVVAASACLNPAGSGRVDKGLLRMLYALMPASAAAESDLVLNPDEAHGWRLGGELLLIHPGSHDRPIRDVGELMRAAAVADPVLELSVGFGIADLVELQLRHSDAVLRALLRVADPRLREPSTREIEVYASMPTLSDTTHSCGAPGRAAAALAWATLSSPIRFATTIHDGNSSPVLRVETPAGLRDLPPPVAFDTGTACGQALMLSAVAVDPAVLDRYRDAVADETFALLSSVADVDRVDQHHGFASFDRGRTIDVSVLANTDPRALAADVRKLEASTRPRKGTIGLIVVAQPSYTEFVSFGLEHRQMMGVEELEFVSQKGERPEDLYLFLESSSNSRLGRVMSWDMLDQYSVWVDAGEMPHGRSDMTMYVATGCEIEWSRVAEPEVAPQHRAFPHRTMRTRAQQLIYWSLNDVAHDLELRGEAAQAFLRDRVVPAAGRVVDELVARYERDDLLLLACTQVNHIEELRHAEPAGWTSHDIDVTGRAARLLVEVVVAAPNTNGDTPGLLDWQELLAAAEAWVEAATQTAVVGRQLEVVRVTTADHGKYSIDDRSSGLVDLDAYALARAEAAEEGEVLALRPLPWLAGNSAALTHEGDARSEWQEVLAAHSAHYGTSLEAVLHVLVLLSDSSFGAASPAEILKYCADGWSGPKEELATAVSLLTLTADGVRSEGVQPWRNQERAFRLASHPLVEIGPDALAVMPAWIRGATFVYLRYLSEGRLPQPPRLLSRPLEQALSAYRNVLTRELEAEVSEALTSAGLPFQQNIKSATTLGMRSLSGEIDHVCAVPATATLWVLEEKDPVDDFSVDAVRRSLARFVEPGAYIDKLRQKVSDVHMDASAVARALGAVNPERWQVRGAFVTRRPIPAAFAGSDFPFTTPAKLTGLLTSVKHPGKARRRRR